MILYENMKSIVHSPDGETVFFDIVAGVLLRYTLATYSVMLCPD